MKLYPIVAVCLTLLSLTGCKPAPVTPMLPPISSVPEGRPAATIQNTEVMEQSFKDAAAGQ